MLYVVTDSYGTCKRTWTLAGAMEWLPYCSPQACIHTTIGQRLVAARQFTRTEWSTT